MAIDADPTIKADVVLLSGVRHADQYAHLLAASPDARVAAVAEDPGATGWMRADSERLAHELDVELITIEAALVAGRFDAAVVCSEPTRHAALARAAVTAGLDVVVDKPVSTTAADARSVRDLAREGGVIVAVVSRVGTPAMRRARASIDSGRVGFVRHIDVEFLAGGTHFATSVERPELVVDPLLSGGGEVMNFMGYCFDAVRHLSGCELVDVYCQTSTMFSDAHRRYGVEDAAVASVGLQHGVTATITVGRIPAAPAPGPLACSVRVLGSHGHLMFDDGRPSTHAYLADRTHHEHPLDDAAGAAVAWTFAQFFDARRTRESLGYTIDDAVAAVTGIEAAYASAAQGRVIHFDPRSAPVAAPGGAPLLTVQE